MYCNWCFSCLLKSITPIHSIKNLVISYIPLLSITMIGGCRINHWIHWVIRVPLSGPSRLQSRDLGSKIPPVAVRRFGCRFGHQRHHKKIIDTQFFWDNDAWDRSWLIGFSKRSEFPGFEVFDHWSMQLKHRWTPFGCKTPVCTNHLHIKEPRGRY